MVCFTLGPDVSIEQKQSRLYKRNSLLLLPLTLRKTVPIDCSVSRLIFSTLRGTLLFKVWSVVLRRNPGIQGKLIKRRDLYEEITTHELQESPAVSKLFDHVPVPDTHLIQISEDFVQNLSSVFPCRQRHVERVLYLILFINYFIIIIKIHKNTDILVSDHHEQGPSNCSLLSSF